MPGKQAKILTGQQVNAALRRARLGQYPRRDRVMILLSFKAGLRAGEIAKLTWPMLLDADGRIGDRILLPTGRPRRAAVARSRSTRPCGVNCRNCSVMVS